MDTMLTFDATAAFVIPFKEWHKSTVPLSRGYSANVTARDLV
jgi:hypothetical protein